MCSKMVQVLSLSFLILSLMFSVSSISTPNSNVYVQCSQLNFTSGTPYESSVNTLFTSLVDSASVCNFNKFETSPQSDVVYGLFQCRGDLSSPNCKDCVTNSLDQLKTACPMSTGGEIHLEGCFVKYDETSFFGAQSKIEKYKRCSPSIGYNSDVLNRINDVLTYLVSGNGQYFCGGISGSIQGVAQCMQDLSISDCQDCLSEASGRLRSECETSNWGDMYLDKCYVRYDDHGNENFENNGNSKSKNSSGGGSKKDIPKWIGYIIALAVGLVGGGGLAFVAQNCCIINVCNKRIKMLEKGFEGTKKVAESAKEKAEQVERKVEEGSTKGGPAYNPHHYSSSTMSMWSSGYDF